MFGDLLDEGFFEQKVIHSSRYSQLFRFKNIFLHCDNPSVKKGVETLPVEDRFRRQSF